MRIALLLVGTVLIGLGVATLLGRFTYTRHDTVAKIGGFSATVEETETVPPWLGALGVALGAALAIGGALRKD